MQDMDPQQRERRYIANPNFLGPSNSALGPSTQQSTPQIGPPDPFHRNRDPFRPTSHTESRESAPQPYWSASASAAASRPPEIQHRDVLQPAPPPPQSPFSRQPPYSREHPRRLSLGGEPQNEPTPSAVSSSGYLSRHMPPPASSPHHSPPNPLNYSQSRGPHRTPPSYSSSRELPSTSPSARQNNMSISSIMASDSPATSRPPAWSPPSISNGARPSTAHPPRSPRLSSLYGQSFNERKSTRSDHSPLQWGPLNNSRSAGGPISTTPSGPAGPPTKYSPPHLHSSKREQILPPRPYSQPGPEARNGVESGQLLQNFEDTIARRQEERKAYERQIEEKDRDRDVSKENGARDRAFNGLVGPPYAPYQTSANRPVYGPVPRPSSPYRNYREHAPLQYGRWSPQNANDIRDADRPIASREGPPLPPEELEGLVYGPFLPQDPRSHEAYATSQGHGRGFAYDDRSSVHNESIGSSFNDRSSKAPVLDAQLRRSLEDTQHRSILGASYDSHRRTERSSPLPQAVQGASSQPVGSGRDPTIKTEFGRMFSGLGSGVGSTPVPMPPPSNGSPTPARGVRDRHSKSPGAERLKRSYEAEGRLDGEFEGRVTPGTTGGRGGKRSKQSHATPHHHHHPVGHHHHHHHHRHSKVDDDMSGGFAGRRISTTPFNTLKFSTPLSNGPTTPSTTGVPRHHHHHHPPHHHHHHRNPGQVTPGPIQQIRRPITTIKTNPLLESIAHRPRKHLGSQLYSPHVTPPPASTPSFTKFLFASNPKPFPFFEAKENCTFTVRIPRNFLTDKSREHVCSQRQIWGTDVYTDDSDVLAAAMHAGWIRGAWSDDVDISMLELNPAPSPTNGANGEGKSDQNVSDKTTATTTLSEPPSGGPVSPPPHRDAHVTVLILPPLEKYAPCTWHGIRSRAWGDNHDGMSFKIHKIEWVDEGPEARLAEKGAKALSRRLVEKQKSAARCATARPLRAVKSSSRSIVAA